MSTLVEESESGDIMEVAKAHQGKVTGVIIPPPEIRAVVDKTAQFVARNGNFCSSCSIDQHVPGA